MQVCPMSIFQSQGSKENEGARDIGKLELNLFSGLGGGVLTNLDNKYKSNDQTDKN